MKKWYDNAVIYQIYPKSFQDSNQDGVGDLQGIIKRLPYLKKLGVNTLWLNPIYVSPQVDNGYDVANYYAIDPQMGSMADFEALLKEAHKFDMHLLMDFVLNHTSDQHPWFQDAIKSKDSIYRDYYIFAGENGKRPNNWASFFGGSVWEKDPLNTGEYYFHLFDKHMPDLNWKNPEVRHAMLDIARFWLDKGVDGLRIDAFIHVAKADLYQNFPGNIDPVVAEPFYANRPQVLEWMNEFSHTLKAEYPDVYLLGEASSADVTLANDYLDPNGAALDSVITFRYFTEDLSKLNPNFSDQYQPRDLDFEAFKQNQVVWQQTVDKPNLYLNNHDLPRIATRFAKNDNQAKMYALLMHLQKGTSVIYYGEELGLRNINIPEYEGDESVDRFVKEATEAGLTKDEAMDMVNQMHRLASRGPMLWDDSPYGGFSNVEPWIKGINEQNVSAQDQEDDPNSFLNFYRKLISLKQTELFAKGAYRMLNIPGKTYVYERHLDDQSAIVALNFDHHSIEIDTDKTDVLMVVGDYELHDGKLLLEPDSGIVLK
ncbi:MAG: alpha-glucosidase [Lactobacillus sp.]|nr:alpha-glucosidase [Lactobacillus sp.]